MVRRVVLALMALMMVAESVPADVVHCRDGRRITGRVTNRDQLRRSPGSVRIVWIEADSSGVPAMSLARADVDAVVLEDGSQSERFDLTTGVVGERGMLLSPSRPAVVKQGHPGVVLIATGAALMIVGAAVKLGDKEVEPGLPGLAATRSYGPVNYLAMAVGAGLVIGGIARSSIHRGARETQTGAVFFPAAPAVAITIRF